MDSFLLQIARRIASEHPRDTDRVLVVFNNRRSLRFFERQFVGLQQTMFLPRTMVIDDLVADLGGLQTVTNEFLLFELYTIHREIEGEEAKYKTFDEFISFGDLMLGDFSELDQYCVDARDLFGNLHDLKRIGEWDIEGTELTDFQRRYLHFYRSLYEYYRRLRERLLAQGKAYGGMAYRLVAEQIGTLADRVDAEAVYFVGFNAITECERRIIGEFCRRGTGHLVTDGDVYFMQPEQESGHFLRKHCQEFKEIAPKGPSLFAQGERRVTIVECPENLLQCKWAGQLLEEHPEWLDGWNGERTAVVLADEGLLLPAMNALPEGDYTVNISMGYAFSDSNMYLLAQRLLTLHATATPQGYHHGAVLELLSDRYVQRLLGDGPTRGRVSRWLMRGNIIRCTGAELRALLGDSAETALLFPDQAWTAAQWLEAMPRLVGDIVGKGLLERNRKERQAAGSLVEIVDYLRELDRDYGYIDTLDTLRKIYQRIAQRHQVALVGQAMTGLQVMGMLETRNLDFDRVILLSVGEGTLPASRSAATLVPYELKRHFQLPTYQEKDSVYAYNFYHLLLRARDVYLVYSSASEAMGKGEPSRFIRQVECELAPKYGIEVNHLVVNNSEPVHEAHPDLQSFTSKRPAVLERLRAMASEGFTPTGFEDYLECPLRYYYTRVLGVRRDDELAEDLDASQLGTCIHNILQRVYSPWLGARVPAEGLREALEHLPQLIDEEFEALFRHGRSTEGRNHFMRAVAETQIRTLLTREVELLGQGHTIEMVALEEKLGPMLLAEAPDGTPVRLRGTVDRIDRLDGKLRIIDYKTGSLNDEEIAYRSTPNSKGEQTLPGKWFQLMCYGLLYLDSHPTSETIQTGIYPLRNLQSGVRLASCNNCTELTAEHFLNFRHQLADICLQLLDPAEPFRTAERPVDCHLCDVRTFCPLHP